jgi:hypothetical protein
VVAVESDVLEPDLVTARVYDGSLELYRSVYRSTRATMRALGELPSPAG